MGSRSVTPTKIQRYGSSAHQKKISQTKRSELDLKMEYMQQYVKEQGDTALCNVNKAEKGTVSLDEEQGEVLSV